MSLLQSLRFNQMTAYPWSLEKTVRNRSTSGIPYIGVWCHKLDRGAEKTWGDSQREPARREPVPSRGGSLPQWRGPAAVVRYILLN
jgi:hypothetical protein